MIPGHTRFLPDQYFGLIKRKTRISSITQLSKVVLESTQTRLNCVQLAYDPDHDYLVPCYDWKCFLSTLFKTIPMITKYHHFYVSNEIPGTVKLLQGFVVDCHHSYHTIDHYHNHCAL